MRGWVEGGGAVVVEVVVGDQGVEAGRGRGWGGWMMFEDPSARAADDGFGGQR